MFAAAEGRPLGLIGVPVAIAGYIFTDRLDVFRLPAVWANVCGVFAFLASGYEFFSESIEGRLLGFGHLLLYLGWILMLQPKDKSRFWWLCALSTLQVATASVLTNAVWFPLAAILFMLLGLWTLSIFSLDRAVTRSAGVEHSARAAHPSSVPEQSSAIMNNGSFGTDVSRSRSNIRAEGSSRWISARFVIGVLTNCLLSGLIGIAIFVLTPRIWHGSFLLFGSDATSSAISRTGFAEEVSLGDMGEILENPDIVLEAEFFDYDSDEQLNVEKVMAQMGYATPLFRGKVMGKYSDGRWSTPWLAAPLYRFIIPEQVPVIRQDFMLHPTGTTAIFTAGRAFGCDTKAPVQIGYDLFNGMFAIEPQQSKQQSLRQALNYTAFSTHSGDSMWTRRERQYPSLMNEYFSSLSRIPHNLPQLVSLAEKLTQTEDDSQLPDDEAAQRIVSHLRDSGEYQYTLKVGITDPSIDPVEDFLFNRKAGHCEYFASSLALLLRAVGIPTRLVSGFKGGQLNESTGRYEVRQLHAHAWVEALINNQWVVLDPTPAARDATVASFDTSLTPYQQMQRLLQSWWTRGLLMNQSQQQRAIYQPLRDFMNDGLQSVRSVGLIQAIADWFRRLRARPENWISWRGFLTAFTLGVLLVGLYSGARAVWKKLRRALSRQRRHYQKQHQIVEFYENFRIILARKGYFRAETATPREFAVSLERYWQQSDGSHRLSQLPTTLTDAFYGVRFGSHPLSPSELSALEQSLAEFESWLKSNGDVRSRTE